MVSLSFNIRTDNIEAFEPHTRACQLEVGAGYLTIFLWDTTNHKPLSVEVFTGIGDWENDWELMLQQSALLGYKGLETYVIFADHRVLPTPAVFFDGGEARHQMDVLFGPDFSAYAGADVLPEHDMVINWKADGLVYHLLTSHFEVIHAKSIATLLIENFSNTALHRVGSFGYLVITGAWSWIALWRDGRLLLMNAYQTTHPDDLSYHMLNGCKQWGIAANTIAWEASGMLSMDAPMWQAADRFFEKLLPATHSFELGSDIPGHYFAHILQNMHR